MKNSYRKLARFGCAAIGLTGISVAASGAAVPIRADIAQRMLETAYAEAVSTGVPQKPWDGADMAPIGRISVPRLKVSEIILDSGTREAMRAGPTLVPGSAAIGSPGTSVIAAHRDTHFAFLKDVRVGDIITASGRDGAVLNYRVTNMQIVEADKFRIPKDLAYNELALSTCYPFGAIRGGNKRYVVHAIIER